MFLFFILDYYIIKSFRGRVNVVVVFSNDMIDLSLICLNLCNNVTRESILNVFDPLLIVCNEEPFFSYLI